MPSYKIWLYSSDNGDGSSSTLVFGTETQVNEYRQKHDASEWCDRPFDEDSLWHHTLEFDDEGVLQNPDQWEE